MDGVFIGMDPGGADAFGWAVLEDAVDCPLRVLDQGVSENAVQAVEAAEKATKGRKVLGVGIDAPLYWVAGARAEDERRADHKLRKAITRLEAPGGTVGHVNSLRGACVVQGVIVARLLQERFQCIPVSEAHPKAALWLLKLATKEKKPAKVSVADLAKHVAFEASWGEADHARDAAIGALSAWAMRHRPAGWQDLALLDPVRISPLLAPAAYWMPSLVSAATPSPPAR